MASAPFEKGNELMKWEPFGLLAAYGAAGLASVREGYPPEFIVALVSGGFLALCFSLWKSRQRKADSIDTALWAMIGCVGSMALAFFVAPSLEGKFLPLVGVELTMPLAAFLIAVGGTPFLEWLLTGEAFQLAKRMIDKFAGDKAGAA